MNVNLSRPEKQLRRLKSLQRFQRLNYATLAFAGVCSIICFVTIGIAHGLIALSGVPALSISFWNNHRLRQEIQNGQRE